MPIGLTAKLNVKEGKNEEFEALFKELQEAVNNNEDGCNFYAIHRSRTDSQLYIVLEQYEDEAALSAHGKTEHYVRLGGEMAGCLAGAPEVELLDAL